ncbi:unnamed protein product [Sympodiomycopsis kandeliae]
MTRPGWRFTVINIFSQSHLRHFSRRQPARITRAVAPHRRHGQQVFERGEPDHTRAAPGPPTATAPSSRQQQADRQTPLLAAAPPPAATTTAPPPQQQQEDVTMADNLAWNYNLPYRGAVAAAEEAQAGAKWDSAATEEERKVWLKPDAFGVERMLDFSWVYSMDGDHWTRYEPTFPKANLSVPGINNEGQGARSAWLWIQEQRLRDEEDGHPWLDHLDAETLMATADEVQHITTSVDHPDEPGPLRARETTFRNGFLHIFGGENARSSFSLSEGNMDLVWPGWRGEGKKRGQVRKDVWVMPIVFGIDDPANLQLNLSADGEEWVTMDLTHLERAVLWKFWAIDTRRLFAAAHTPWADGLNDAGLEDKAPVRPPRTLCSVDHEDEPEDLLAWTKESENVCVLNAEVKPPRAVFLAICPNFSGSRSSTISAPGGWWIKASVWGKSSADELSLAGSSCLRKYLCVSEKMERELWESQRRELANDEAWVEYRRKILINNVPTMLPQPPVPSTSSGEHSVNGSHSSALPRPPVPSTVSGAYSVNGPHSSIWSSNGDIGPLEAADTIFGDDFEDSRCQSV